MKILWRVRVGSRLIGTRGYAIYSWVWAPWRKRDRTRARATNYYGAASEIHGFCVSRGFFFLFRRVRFYTAKKNENRKKNPPKRDLYVLRTTVDRSCRAQPAVNGKKPGPVIADFNINRIINNDVRSFSMRIIYVSDVCVPISISC